MGDEVEGKDIKGLSSRDALALPLLVFSPQSKGSMVKANTNNREGWGRT